MTVITPARSIRTSYVSGASAGPGPRSVQASGSITEPSGPPSQLTARPPASFRSNSTRSRCPASGWNGCVTVTNDSGTSRSLPGRAVCGFRGHAVDSRTCPVGFRDFHRAHWRREPGAGGEPVPDLVQIVLQRGLELRDRHRVHAGCTLIRLDFLPRLPDSPLGDIKRLAWCFQLVHATPPREHLVDRTNTVTNDPAPSFRPHYKGIITTTNRSASASRDGTQPLTVQPLGVLPIGRSREPGPPVSGRAFSCSVRKPQTGLASPTCRTPPGQ